MVAFFGGGKKDNTSKEYLESIEIGKILAENGHIVKNGGYYGLMEAVSKGVYEYGGSTIGFTCKTFKFTNGNKYLTDTIITDDIYDRLRFLIEDTDIFIVQKGGVGTLSELFLVIDIIRKMDNKPKVLLIGSFWSEIISFLKNYFDDLEYLIIIEDYKKIKDYL